MRLALFLLLSSLAVAATPEVQLPHPAPPKLLQLAIPQIPWWNSAEKARVASRSPYTFSAESLSLPKPMPLLLPYPQLAPRNGRSYFLLQ